MIINTIKVKSEALLLFCRDLINSYKDQDQHHFKIDEHTIQYVDEQINHLLSAINVVVQPLDYYTRNQRVSRIAMITKSYQFINKQISKQLQNGENFNPSMLCFALLCSWFAELGVAQGDKEYLYFSLYSYGEIYDELLLKSIDSEYKQLNLKMLHIAESVIVQLHQSRF